MAEPLSGVFMPSSLVTPSGNKISNDATLTSINDEGDKEEVIITTGSVVYDHDDNPFQVMWIESTLSILSSVDGKGETGTETLPELVR